MRFRDVLPPYVADEFDSLIMQIKAWALEEHDEEGHHVVEDFDLARVPVGASMKWFTDTPPSGWIFSHGQQLNRVTYKALFDLWGTSFGVGDGSTTFNVPDERGTFPLCKAASGTGSTIGETGGDLDHTHSGGSITGSTANESTHTHGSGSYATQTHNHGGSTGNETLDLAKTFDNFSQASADASALIEVVFDSGEDPHDHTISTQAALDVTGTSGAGSAHSHGAGTLAVASIGAANPAYFTVNWIVFTGVA